MATINGINPYPNRNENCNLKEAEKPINKVEKSSAFIGYNPYWDLNEIVLCKETKEVLQDVIVFCSHRDRIVEEWNLKRFLKGTGGCTGINMYGKPGTGKSIAAEAIAKATGKKIIKVDYSEIQDSKWGGTEKKISELFKTAAESESIIFFDEADALLGKRKSDGANAETNNQIKSHLLTLLDSSNVIVIFATNLFENYDRAFFRRILFHINFKLPNAEQLMELWKFHLGDEIPKSKDSFSYEIITEYSKGLSGGDIKNLTLKICIRLVSRNMSHVTNELVKEEIRIYKEALANMDTAQKEISKKGTTLIGKDADIAKEVLDSRNK